ncbi:MAG: hypothetical protein WBF71_03420 [Microthrixaceae bacterium]
MNRRSVRLVGSLLLVMSIGVACGTDVSNVGSAPGYSSRERKGKNGEFKLVEPAGSGASTTILGPAPTLPLPEDVEGQLRPELPGVPRADTFVPTPMPESTTPTTTTAVTTTTTTPPSPTTTLPPMYPVPVVDLKSLCGMNQYFQSLVSVFVNPGLNRKQTVLRAQEVLKAYESATPVELRVDMAKVKAVADDLIRRLIASDYDINEPSLRYITHLLFTQNPIFSDFFASYNRLLQYEIQSCKR